ncbi:MAG: glycosyltransferase [Aquihabitans sp.]
MSDLTVDPTRRADRMLVVSAVVHHRWNGEIHGYTPYVREVDAWAHLFGELRIAGPVLDQPPHDDMAPFRSPNVTIIGLPPTGGETWSKKAVQALLVPVLCLRLMAQMRWADAIQVRCPSNLGVLAVPLAPLFSRRLHCKYAGMWGSFDGEPRSSRFQRRILVSRWWRGPVSVYGRSPTDPPNVHEAFSTALTESQLAVSRPGDNRPAGSPLRVLFVGRLSAAKHVDAVVRAIAGARAGGTECVLEVIGDGPMRASLEALTAQLDVTNSVCWSGSLPIDEVLDAYRRSDVLALISQSEGWPKVIVEAMAFGMVVIGNDRGLVPVITGDGRGFSVPSGDAAALETLIVRLAREPQTVRETANLATAWARPFSLERFALELDALLADTWPVTKVTAGAAQVGSSR